MVIRLYTLVVELYNGQTLCVSQILTFKTLHQIA